MGYGVFDAVYKPPVGALFGVGYGRDYVNKSMWTAKVAQGWEGRLTALRDEWYMRWGRRCACPRLAGRAKS